MDILIKLALWAHFVALGVGGAASFGMPVLLGMMGAAVAEARPSLSAAMMRLSALGRMAVGTLIVTGVFLLFAKYGLGGVNHWFWVKMLVVAGLIALIVYSVRNGAKARGGDAAAAARAPKLAKLGMATFALVVLTAVLTFD